jgi:hypothetical protein
LIRVFWNRQIVSPARRRRWALEQADSKSCQGRGVERREGKERARQGKERARQGKGKEKARKRVSREMK